MVVRLTAAAGALGVGRVLVSTDTLASGLSVSCRSCDGVAEAVSRGCGCG
jgi:hypothetical protein